ncbi:HlyC/CorC family transporter [Rhodocyclus tenuis]|uniref:Mg2+/Co2+ transporter CorB n=1 Tax=Rhodocyclus tenuis TaxID=1066 RepID=A0A840G7P8_RHOTE|nr:HlyC/CorC family transporter [Rhodocyclus tenuis]MBB4247431.1 Mg2+/Co2+ transporter CorB [Rhodocyclus tenuis]
MEDDLPLPALFAALGVLLVLSGFFSMSETAMMAANRYRLRHLAQKGHRGAIQALGLLENLDRLLGVILLGNNLINAASATLVSVITIQLFGDEKWVLGVSTLFVTFAILVVSEISPKVIGARYADRLAIFVGYVLKPLLRYAYPVVWFVNLFVKALLRLLRLPTGPDTNAGRLSTEELRTLVLESGNFIPPKHKSLLVNLFELEEITVEDVMTPRASIEALDLDAPWEEVTARMATSYHTRLAVYRGDPDNIVGVVHLRRLLGPIQRGELTQEALAGYVQEPYFIPAGTPVVAQLQFFQDNRRRTGLVVDEYGDVLGLVTMEDIVEEIIGEFTTSLPGGSGSLKWGEDGSVLVEGRRPLREINRKLGLKLPLDGPKTLNGLIVEYFRDIPEAGIGIKIAGVPIEIVQTENRSIRVARIFRPKK